MLVQWRRWLGLKPTESEFVADLVRGRSDAAYWVHDAGAHTLTHANGVLNLVNMHREYASAAKFDRSGLLVKYRALLSPEKISALWSLAQPRIYPLLRSRFDRTAVDIDQRRSGKKVVARAARPFSKDLEVVLGYDFGAMVTQVYMETVGEWGVAIDLVFERAFSNLKALRAPTWRLDGAVWQLRSADGYNESFLPWPKVFDSMSAQGTILAAVPNRGVLLSSKVEDS